MALPVKQGVHCGGGGEGGGMGGMWVISYVLRKRNQTQFKISNKFFDEILTVFLSISSMQKRHDLCMKHALLDC